MKNFVLLCLVTAFITNLVIAQNTDSTTYFLDKTAVTSNILYPVLENDTNALWLRHNGVNENLATAKQVKQAYLELTNYHLVTDELSDIETIAKNAEYEINTNKRIPLLMLDMDYHLFKSYAIDSGLIEVREGKFYDVANRTELPYQQQHLFMAASLVDKLLYDSLTFYIDSNFYFSNTTKPTHFQIDFGDGLGYRTVNFGQTVNVYYSNMTDIANKMVAAPSIKIEAIYPNNTVLKSGNPFEPNSCTGGFPPEDEIWNIFASTPFSTSFPNNYPVDPSAGNFARANAYVKYGTGHPVGEVIKPIVFVEGIDFGRYYSFNPIQNGDFGWCGFWGKDTDFNEFQNSPTVLNDLLNNGYDVFLLDFRDGADFIERNAMALIRLLELIKIQGANSSQPTEPTVVLGASMGGQVARYALAYMEQNNLQHCVREYISFDSPHKGANIPIALQEWIEFFAYNGPGGGNQGARDNLNLKLDRPAAKQLLLYHHDNSLGGFNVPERAAYQNTIDAIGYPNKLRKVAIANGSGNSIKQPNLNSGDLLLKTDWSPGACLNAKLIQGDCYAMPNFLMFAGKLPKNTANALACLALIPAGCNVCVNTNLGFDTRTIASGSSLLSLDNAPGGFRNTALDIEQEYKENPDAKGDITADPQGHGVSPNQCFIPTISALDINTNDLLFDASTIQFPEPNPNFTPFEAFYIPITNNNQNQQHVFLSAGANGNMQWALNEILDTENKLKSPLTSSSPNNGVFNYGRKESRYISSVVIGNGGQLNVNANLLTDYGTSTTPQPSTGIATPVAGSHLKMETCECGDVVVEIQNGGEFILGENTPNNSATVIFHERSTLIIRSGGRLIVKDNSNLIIEHGAKLVVEAGAEIQLLGDEAVLEIQGELEIGNNATFTFTHPNSNSGYLKFNVPFNPCSSNPNWACPVITAGNNVTIDLRGDNKTDKILEITDGDMLIPDNVEFFRLWFGKAEFKTTDSRLSIGNKRYNLLDATFEGINDGRGVFVYGNTNSFIIRCDFDQVKVRGELYFGSKRLDIRYSSFNNGAFVETFGKGVFFNEVNFDNTANLQYNSFAGLQSYWPDLPSFYNKGNIDVNILTGGGNNNFTHNGGISNWVSFSSIILRELTINRGTVQQDMGELKVRCTSILGNPAGLVGTGIGFANNAQLRMSSLDGMGYNTINQNRANISGANISLMDIEWGYNDFSYGRIHVNYDFSAQNIPTILPGNRNIYFPNVLNIDPNTTPDNTFFSQYPNNQPKAVVYFGTPGPVIPQSNIIPIQWNVSPVNPPTSPCNGGSSGGSSTGTSSPLKNCVNCPLVNSANFNNVPLNQAIEMATQQMELADSTKNDLTAITLFHEIFTHTTIDYNDTNQAFLVNYAYANMKNALQNCFITGRIDEADNTPNLHLCTQHFQQVIGLRKKAVTAQNVDEQFYLELDEALTFRLVGRRDDALQKLNAIDNCFLTDKHYKRIKLLRQVTKIENDVLKGNLPKEEAYKLFDQIELPEQPTTEIISDPSSNVHPSVVMGNNTVVGANVTIDKNVVIGNNVTIEDNVKIEKDVVIGDNVTISKDGVIEKSVTILFDVELGKNVKIKKNSYVANNTTIDKDVVIKEKVHINSFVAIRKEVVIKKNANIGSGAFIGKNAVINEKTDIGELSILRKNTITKDKVKVGDRNIIARDVVLKTKVETGKNVKVKKNIQVPSNQTICDGDVVNNNYSYNNSCIATPPNLSENTNSYEFAMGYAQTRTNFLNGITLSNNSRIIAGQEIQFIPDNLSSSYLWEFGDCGSSTKESPTYIFEKPGIYLVTLTQSNACASNTLYSAVSVFPSPKSDIAPIVPFCTSNSDVVVVRNTNLNGGVPTCLTQANPNTPSYIPLNEENCQLNFVWNFENDTVQHQEIFVLTDSNALASSFNQTFASNGNFQTALNTTFEVREETVYNWENATNSMFDTTVAISSSILPVISFEGCAAGQVQFYNNISGGQAPYTHSWVFGNGLTSNLASPLINVQDTGNLSVALTITDDNGCTKVFNTNVYIADCNASARVGTNNSDNEGDDNSKEILSNNNDVKTYPNPTDGQITFYYKLNTKNAQLIVTDIMGKTVFSCPLKDKNKITLDLSSYGKGVFLYRIVGNNEIIKSDKIILMK